MTLSEILERTASRSPSTFGLAVYDPNGRMVLRIKGDRLTQSLLELVGHRRRRGGGRLYRFLPLAHPMFPGLYADRIAAGTGIGKGLDTPAEVVVLHNG